MIPADLRQFLDMGGPAMWAIAALSVTTLALILWKLWRFGRSRVWAGTESGGVAAGLAAWATGDRTAPTRLTGTGVLATVTRAAMLARLDPGLDDAAAREMVTLQARAALLEARRGLRALELIVTIAPLLGLFGTVLGMIAAFQTLQTAGSRADPAALAGGIWEALLTTAAGMAVAIPAAAALAWCDGVIDRLASRIEDAVTRVFARGPRP